MIKKYFMLALLAVGMTTAAMADDMAVSIIDADGNELKSAEMATIDNITMADSCVYVTVAGSDDTYDTYKLERKNIYQILFAPKATATGISSATVAAEKVTITAEGGELSVSGIAPGTAVAVYSLNGQNVLQTKAQGSTARLSVSGLKGGVYIVRAGNKAIKIVKK